MRCELTGQTVCHLTLWNNLMVSIAALAEECDTRKELLELYFEKRRADK